MDGAEWLVIIMNGGIGAVLGWWFANYLRLIWAKRRDKKNRLGE